MKEDMQRVHVTAVATETQQRFLFVLLNYLLVNNIKILGDA